MTKTFTLHLTKLQWKLTMEALDEFIMMMEESEGQNKHIEACVTAYQQLKAKAEIYE